MSAESVVLQVKKQFEVIEDIKKMIKQIRSTVLTVQRSRKKKKQNFKSADRLDKMKMQVNDINVNETDGDVCAEQEKRIKVREIVFGRFAYYRTATMLRMSRNIVPQPCCGCTCSATRLLGRHPSRCSPPSFHNHVGVICTLAVRTARLASRVACVRAWSGMSHPRPPDRSQHGCTVGVDQDPPV